MGIESTMNISKERAFERIIKIYQIIVNKEYRILEEESNEEYLVEDYIDEFVLNDIDIFNIHKFTNRQLENIIDRPFFRFSMFENYDVIDED
jgi:hypothetical protein